MATIVTRAAKGAPLTHGEVDANFTGLNDELALKLENATDIENALGYTPADAAVLGDIEAALIAING